jgi:hypothetical protein
MGTKDDGTPDRRHRSATTRAAVLKKVADQVGELLWNEAGNKSTSTDSA